MLLRATIDTLSTHPSVGFGGSLSGFCGSLFTTTPIFQFLSAFFGALIGVLTLVGMAKKYYERNIKEKGNRNS